MKKNIVTNEIQQKKIQIVELIAHSDISKKFLRKKKFLINTVIITITLITLLFCTTLLWQESNYGHINISGEEQSIPGTNFKITQNQVYIFKQGDGYFPIPNVTSTEFTGLALTDLPRRADELYSNVGKTSKHVYWQDHSLSKLDPAQTQYVGNDYTKDDHHVYFQDKLLLESDAQSFNAVLHPIFNTLGYFYGKDKQHVYYKTQRLTDLHPEHVQVFNNSDQYIYDQSHVYYEEQKLQNLDPLKTQVFVGSNRFSRNLNLASDGQYLYFNSQPLPDIAFYKFWGSQPINHKDLRILGVQSNDPYPGHYNFIFSDQNNIYLYDELYQRLQILYQFKKTDKIQVFADRYFTHGNETYRITNTLVKTKGARSSGTTTHGFKIKLIREQDNKVIAQYFARNVYQFSPATLFK